MNKGIIYIVWNRQVIENELQQSIKSIEKLGLDYMVIERESTYDNHKIDLGMKAEMFDLTPYDVTLFLDTDTVVLADDLSYGFEKAARHGLAICIDPACLACRGANHGKLGPDVTEYNTGVVFFNKTPETKILFEAWKQHRNVTSNDQIGFAKAVDEVGFNPLVLPNNWNFRAGIDFRHFGQIRIWHSRMKVTNGVNSKGVGFQTIPGTYSIPRLVSSIKRRAGNLLKRFTKRHKQ